MKYRQLGGEERSVLAALRLVGLKPAEIAQELGRHRSTVGRELKRNAAPYDGGYRARRAQQRAHARRYRSRRNSQFGRGHWERVEELLREEWSPEQVSGHLRLRRELGISHETIYRHIWRDLRRGGRLHEHLRGARKSCRKRYGRYDSRGRLAGKRMIWERPRSVEGRVQTGHWEIDTVMGESQGESSHCVLTLVERKSGYVLIGKLQARTAAETNRALLGLLARHPGRMRTITADNGTEFHWYGQVEALHPVKFYFATPHHSWERGTNENTNGLLRQYLPKGQSMARVTQNQCDLIATRLNNRPRKRHGYKTPNQCFLTN
ncbi:MAG: IS30 family transposase [Chthoniobacterales bacterium]